LVFTDQLGGKFVQAVPALVGNPGVQASHAALLLPPAVRAFFLTREATLGFAELPQVRLKELGVADLLTFRGDG